MKRLLLSALVLIFSYNINGQTAVNVDWLRGFGGSGSDELNASTMDAAGNIYITGKIQYTVDIDPGPPLTTVSVNNTQAYCSKFSPLGVLLWTRNFDGSAMAESNGNAIAVDASGNVYVGGTFKLGTIDFNLATPNVNTVTAQEVDMFIVKYDASGNFNWVKSVGSASANVEPNFFKVDGAGDLVMIGSFYNDIAMPVDFNPATPAYTLSCIAANGADPFVAKYNSNGVMQWAFNIGSGMGEYGYALEVDASNNIYIGGTFQTTADIDPSSSTTSLVISNGLENMFIAKYTPAGNFIWGGAIGGSSGDGAYRLKLDNANNLLVYGYMTSPSLDADIGTPTVTLNKVGAGPLDAFLAKYNSTNGNLIWAKNTGGTAMMYPYALSNDAQNNIYLAGAYSGTADLDFGTATNNYTTVTIGGTDIYLIKCDPNGNFIYAHNFGGGSTGGNEAYSLHVANNNDIILGGMYAATGIDFDPSNANNTLPYVFGRDVFFNRYTQCISPETPTIAVNSLTMCANSIATLAISSGNLNSATTWVWSSVVCGSSTIGVGTTVTVNPVFLTEYFVRGEGGCVTPGSCASATVDVAPLKGITGTVTTGASVPVTGLVQLFRYEGPLTKWDSVTYQNINASGIYSFNAVNSGSYIILAIPTATDLVKSYAPNNATWKGATIFSHGCITDYNININVVPMLTLTPGPGVLSGKIIEGQGYGNKGTITPGSPVGGLTIKGGRNPGGNINAQTVTDANGGYTITGLPISGAGESYFIFVDIPGIDTAGTHHKAITTATTMYNDLDFVVDSDYVRPVDYTGIKELNLAGERISVYPNPASDLVHIKMDAKGESDITLELYDLFGKKVLSQDYRQVQSEFKVSIDVATLNRGVYFVKLRLNSGEAMIKLILSE